MIKSTHNPELRIEDDQLYLTRGDRQYRIRGLANDLSAEILGRTLDELPPHTRKFLLLMHWYVTAQCASAKVARTDMRFTLKELRDATGWTDFQVRDQLTKLVDLEYVLVHRGRGGRQFVYELLYEGEGQSGESFLIGLTDPT